MTQSANLYPSIDPESQLDVALEQGYTDMNAGRTRNAAQVFADIRKDYNL